MSLEAASVLAFLPREVVREVAATAPLWGGEVPANSPSSPREVAVVLASARIDDR